jgi:hypothetical protein
MDNYERRQHEDEDIPLLHRKNFNYIFYHTAPFRKKTENCSFFIVQLNARNKKIETGRLLGQRFTQKEMTTVFDSV